MNQTLILEQLPIPRPLNYELTFIILTGLTPVKYY